jgi:hypothetical protein
MGVTVTGVTGTNGFNCALNTTVDPAKHTYDCTGDFPAGGTTVITALMTVNANAPNDLALTATVDPGNAFGESDETNNTVTETTTVSGTVCTGSPCVDLVTSQILDDPDPATDSGSGATITYTATIVNVGNAPVDPTAIWDIHLEYLGDGTMTVTPPAGLTNCNPVNPMLPNHVHCESVAGADPMDLAPGAGLIFTITVTGQSGPATPTLNVNADIFGAIDEFSETNNSLTEQTTVDG